MIDDTSARWASQPRPIYLSLGDSLATGVQPIGREVDEFRTDEGYPDVLARRMRRRLPGLRLVKLGQPGESTATMIEGGPGSYASGSQLRDAVACLEAERDDVAFITIDIGFNDFSCHDLACVEPGMASIEQRLPGILRVLREAAGAGVPIVGMTVYDPFLRLWLDAPDGQALARVSVEQAVGPINELLRRIYREGGCAVADVEAAFSTTDFETIVRLPRLGQVPLNVARIHDWTWAMTPPPLGPDNHANALGYRAIAHAYAAILEG